MYRVIIYRLILALGLCSALLACGQKGDLYLPEPVEGEQTVNTAPSE